MAGVKYTAELLRNALRKRLPPESYALVFEVCAQTGHASKRADAVAVSLWESNGIEIHGFEIKVSRQDLLKELAQPDKHVHVSRYCHRWWLVTPAGLVQDGELPDNWGLLELKTPTGDLRQAKKAPRLSPAEIDPSFVGSLLRARSRPDEAEIKLTISTRVQEADLLRRRQFEQDVERAVTSRSRRADDVLARAEKIKELTGIDLQGYLPTEDVAAVLRLAVEGKLPSLFGNLRHLSDQLVRTAEDIKKRVPRDDAGDSP